MDKFFLFAIVAKALFGLAEVIAGLTLLTAGAGRLTHLAGWLGERAPRGLATMLAQHLISFITATGTIPDALLLIGHGAIKLFLIIGILRNRLWAYLWMIIAMVGFVGSETVQGAITHRPGMYAIAAVDLIVLVLTVIEWRRHRRGHGLWVGRQPNHAEPDPMAKDTLLLKTGAQA